MPLMLNLLAPWRLSLEATQVYLMELLPALTGTPTQLLFERSAPQRVLNTHSSDQIAHLFADPWPATARAGFPSPICGEGDAMPTHNSLGPDDGYGVKNARTATIEPNEQGAVGPTQMQSAWCALLQDIELMPQYQDFGFQPPPRLEAVAQHADEKEGNCNHATIML